MCLVKLFGLMGSDGEDEPRKVIGGIVVLAVMVEFWRTGGGLENLAGLMVLYLVVGCDLGHLRIESV